MEKKYPWNCPVCGTDNLGDLPTHTACERCDWSNDPYQRDDPDEAMSDNWVSLNRARANWRKYGVVMTERDYKHQKEYCERKYGKRTVPLE